jgi:hypothetical protein
MRTADLLSLPRRVNSVSGADACADADPAAITKIADTKDASVPKRESVVLILPPERLNDVGMRRSRACAILQTAGFKSLGALGRIS